MLRSLQHPVNFCTYMHLFPGVVDTFSHTHTVRNTLVGSVLYYIGRRRRTTLSRLEGGLSERSGWLLVVSQWAGLTAPPMSRLCHTVVSSRSDGGLYKWHMFIWWNSLETTLVTGSLHLVSPVRRLAALG